MIRVLSKQMFTMIPDRSGNHIFGGPPCHHGATPKNTSVPLHMLLSLDLTDSRLPFRSDTLKFLPLYYPLKYGSGGSSVQYRIVSDERIEIIYLSDPEPDPEERAYVKIESFPEVPYSIGKAIPNDDSIDWFTTTIGGTCTLDHESDWCLNPQCPYYNTESKTDLIASIPPAPIDGHDDVWWDFQGSYMLFYFWLCRGCNGIIASNRCT